MKNIPEKIYLQLGEDIGEDFKDHHEISWCVDKIFYTDLEYVSIDQVRQLTSERDDFETQLIAAKLKIEKMKCLMTKEQLDKVYNY